MTNDIKTINIRDIIKSIGEEKLSIILSDFNCKVSDDDDVERFLKTQSIEFVKKNQSVSYLIVNKKDKTMNVLGYFTLAIKPISIKADIFSNNVNKKIARVSNLDKETNTYNLSAYLIAQLGRNFNYNEIDGKYIIESATKVIKELQEAVGGMVMFLEVEEKENLIDFYTRNNFIEYDRRISEKGKSYIQMLKIIK